MNQHSIQTSKILSISYDEVNQILEIKFKFNRVHQYLDFPSKEFLELIKADNKEEFHTKFINCKYHYDTFDNA